jgi:hypothetical protein
MHQQAPEIRWAAPALNHFIRQFRPTLYDLDCILGLLEFVRDHPDDVLARAIVDKALIEPIEGIQGDVYLSKSDVWLVYYNWLPDLIFVVHVDPAKK